MGCPICSGWAAKGGPGEKPRQDGRGAGGGPAGPLALGLHAQVGPHLLKGDLQLPVQHKPLEDLGRVRCQVRTEQGLGSEGALGVSDQYPANERRRLAGAVPDRPLRGEFHGAVGAAVPGNRGAGPADRGLVEQCLQDGSRRPFNGGRPF